MKKILLPLETDMNFDTMAKLAYINEITDLFFLTLESLCKKSLSKDESIVCAESGAQSAVLLVHTILKSLPKEHQETAFQDIQHRFLLTLSAYDKPWVWEVFKDFSAFLPETLLN